MWIGAGFALYTEVYGQFSPFRMCGLLNQPFGRGGGAKVGAAGLSVPVA